MVLSCTIGNEVCVINFFHSFQWIIFKLYIHVHVGAILQMCMRPFNLDEVDFDRNTVF